MWTNLTRTSPGRLLAAVAVAVLLSACDSAKDPARSQEYAVKGTYSAALSADGRFSLIGSITHGGSLWRTATGERLYNWNHKEGESTNIVACSFSPEARFALTADHQTMVLWSTDSGKALTYWTAPSRVLAVDLSPQGNYALLGLENYSVVLFDVKRGGVERTFRHTDRVLSVDLSDDGRYAVTGSEDRTARLWDVRSGEELHRWQHEDDVVTVILSPGGERVLTVGQYDRAVIRDTGSGQTLGELPLGATAIKRGRAITSAAFSNDGERLLTGDTHRGVQLWDSDSQTRLAQWTLPKRDALQPASATVAAVSFTDRSDRFYAIASNGLGHRLEQ